MADKNANVAVGIMEAKEIKKAEPVAAPKNYEATVTSGGIAAFIGDVKSEFKKINWTSFDELQVYTKVVVATTFFFGIGIYIADLVIQGILNGLSLMIRWIS
jgi:preprotein translocase subunit SecE